MAKVVYTNEEHGFGGNAGLQIYNGLDCCVTLEIFNQLTPEHVPYNFTRACAAPALEMMLRGIRVAKDEIASMKESFAQDLFTLQTILDRYALAVWDAPLNPRSNKQLCEFFYEVMNLPKQYKSVKGAKHLAADREALEKLEIYFHAQPIIKVILAMRDIGKALELISSGIDFDGRMRTSYNVCGTETFRWSSSKNVWRRGSNLQNVPDKLRQLFIPDPGMKMGQGDLEQAESRAVAYISGDEKYIQACESGDVHTYACRLTWPELAWTGDAQKDKAIAEEKFYREYSRRYMMKRAGHGSNYNGSPYTLAKHTNTQVKVMQEFQARYFAAFPGIPKWHETVAAKVAKDGHLTNVFGFKRYFLKRRGSDEVRREAIAYNPQSTIGILANLGLWRTWKYAPVQILGQIHDAVLFQFDPSKEAEAVEAVRRAMTIPVPVNGRSMVVPVEIATGWNWGKYNKEKNEHGLRPWTGADNRKAPEVLDRRLSRTY